MHPETQHQKQTPIIKSNIENSPNASNASTILPSQLLCSCPSSSPSSSKYRQRSQAAISVSWIPSLVSSSTVSIPLRSLLTIVSPTCGDSFCSEARVCGIERYERTWGAEWDGEGEETAKALVSITWVPWVLMTLMLDGVDGEGSWGCHDC